MGVHPVALSDRSLQLQDKQKILRACYQPESKALTLMGG